MKVVVVSSISVRLVVRCSCIENIMMISVSEVSSVRRLKVSSVRC